MRKHLHLDARRLVWVVALSVRTVLNSSHIESAAISNYCMSLTWDRQQWVKLAGLRHAHGAGIRKNVREVQSLHSFC